MDWSNQTWLRADTVLLASELDGLFEVYPAAKDEFKKTGADKLSIEEAVQIFVQKISRNGKNYILLLIRKRFGKHTECKNRI